MEPVLRYIPALVLGLSFIALMTQIATVRRQLFIQNFLAQAKEHRLVVEKLPYRALSKSYDMNQETIEEREEVFRFFYLYFDLCFDKFYLYKTRKISKKLWKNWEGSLKSNLHLPALQQNWAAVSSRISLDEDFVSYMNRCIEEVGSTRSKLPNQARPTPVPERTNLASQGSADEKRKEDRKPL